MARAELEVDRGVRGTHVLDQQRGGFRTHFLAQPAVRQALQAGVPLPAHLVRRAGVPLVLGLALRLRGPPGEVCGTLGARTPGAAAAEAAEVGHDVPGQPND
eukprot:14003306-Heterocapsa_arctica.AAC.1